MPSCVKSATTAFVGMLPNPPARPKYSVPPSWNPSGEVFTHTLLPSVDTPELFRLLLSFSVQTMSVVCVTFRFQSTKFAAVSVPTFPSVVMVPVSVHPFVSLIPFSVYTLVVCATAPTANISSTTTANHRIAFISILHLGRARFVRTEGTHADHQNRRSKLQQNQCKG